MCTISPSRLSPLLAAVATRRPDVELDNRDAAGPALRDALDDGTIDAAIMADPAPRDEAVLHRLPLFTERMVIAMATGHRLAGRPRVLHADLSGEAYLSRARCEFGAAVSRSLAERGHAVSVVHSSERDDWILALVAAGLGCALTPEDMATGAGVAFAPFDEPPLARRIELVTLRGRTHGPALGALVREAVRLFVFTEG
jgi:DNA-binding transcriptional LysR family regulator